MAAHQTIATDHAGAVAMPVADGRGADKPDADRTDQRRCTGSERFGIEAHEAPVSEFPAQPSQKDGLGRMCKPHWNAYTNALRKASIARKAAEACPFEGATADECSMIREGSVAGKSDGVPDCPVHGPFHEAEPEPAMPEPARAKRGRKAAVAATEGDAA